MQYLLLCNDIYISESNKITYFKMNLFSVGKTVIKYLYN